MGCHARLSARAVHLRRRQCLRRLQHRRCRSTSKRAYDDGRAHRRLLQAARDRAASRGLGRPRLWHRTTAAPISPHKAVAKELFLKFWKVARRRHQAHPRGHPRRAHHRSAGHACAGHPARPALVPLAAEGDRPARRARQGALCARSRSGQDDARRRSGLARGELRKPAEMPALVSRRQVLAEGHGWERLGQLAAERQSCRH